jgi:RsiW-degrading membrane proteinase PrsW (M82 family)
MWVDINIGLIMGVLLPPLFYVLLIFFTAPYKTITLGRSLVYFIGGLLSITFVEMFYAFINIQTTSIFYECFFSIAPREEISKLCAFGLVSTIINKKDRHPVATMYYMGMVGLGFAMIENLHYVFKFGPVVLYTRTFTSTIAHLIFTLFMGYWVGLSQVDLRKYGNRSIFGVLMFKYKKIRRCIYILIGLLCAIAFHGLWNFNLSQLSPTTIPFMILMIIFGLATSKFASTDLYNHNRKSLK